MEMMMMKSSKSFRIQRSYSSCISWKRLERSNSLLLASELATTPSSDFAWVTPYERLSQSMQLTKEYGACKLSKPPAAWRYLGKVFSLKKTGGKGQVVAEAAAKPPEVVAEVVGKKNKRSSWLPDPHRRWPVQGW